MERGQHPAEPEYEPPIVEELETDGEGATVSVCGMLLASVPTALVEPTDNPPAADDE